MANLPSAPGSSRTGKVSLKCPRRWACSLEVLWPIDSDESESGHADSIGKRALATGVTHSWRCLRRYALIGAVLVLLVGSILEITANNWKHWLGGAVVIRLGVGLAQAILVTFVSEISPFQIRGFMIGAYQLSLAFGQLIVAVAAQLFTVHRPDQWKPLVAIEFGFTGILLIIIWFVPESHLYHARKGNHEAAKRSMTRLYGTAPDYDVVSERGDDVCRAEIMR